MILPPLTARLEYAVQHDDLGKGHKASAQRTPACVGAPVQGQPPAADKHVRDCIITPHKPQVSLQAAALQSDHVPPGGHADVVVVGGSTTQALIGLVDFSG